VLIEQSCTDSQPLVCHCEPVRRNFIRGLVVHPFLVQVRTLLAFITDQMRKLFAMKTQRAAFGSQRMCPFCGLITPRSKPFCLECGKSLRGVQLRRKDARQG
jgi:hypothetical protein